MGYGMGTVHLLPTMYRWLHDLAQEKAQTPDQVAETLLRQHLAPQYASIEVIERALG